MPKPQIIPASQMADTSEATWLSKFLADAAEQKLCVKYFCTTCGAVHFRQGLWKRVAEALGAVDVELPPHHPTTFARPIELNQWTDEMRLELANQLAILPITGRPDLWRMVDLRREQRETDDPIKRAEIETIMDDAWQEIRDMDRRQEHEFEALRLVLTNLWDDLGKSRFQELVEPIIKGTWVGYLLDGMKQHDADRERKYRDHKLRTERDQRRGAERKRQRQLAHAERLRSKPARDAAYFARIGGRPG